MTYSNENLKLDLKGYIKKFKINQNNIFSNKIKENIQNLLAKYEKDTIFTTLTDIKEKDNDVDTVENDPAEYILKTFTETYEYGKLWKNIGKLDPDPTQSTTNKIDITVTAVTNAIKKKIVNRESLTESEHLILKNLSSYTDSVGNKLIKAINYIEINLDDNGEYSTSVTETLTKHYFVPDDKIKFGKKWELYDGIPEPNIQIKYDNEELGKKLYDKIMANKVENSNSDIDKIYRVEIEDKDIPENLKIYNYIEYIFDNKKYYFIPLNNDILNNLLLDIRFNKNYVNNFNVMDSNDILSVTHEFTNIINKLNNKKERINLSDLDLSDLVVSGNDYKNSNCTSHELVKMRYTALMLYIKKLFNYNNDYDINNIFDLTNIDTHLKAKDIIKRIYINNYDVNGVCKTAVSGKNSKTFKIDNTASNINNSIKDRIGDTVDNNNRTITIFKNDKIIFDTQIKFPLLSQTQIPTENEIVIRTETKYIYEFTRIATDYKTDSIGSELTIHVKDNVLDNLNELAIYFYLKETLLKLHNNIYLELNKFIENNGNLIHFSKDIKEVIEVLNFIKILIFLTIIHILKNDRIQKDLDSILSDELDKIYLNVMNSHSISDSKIDDSISKINDIDDKKEKTNENIKSLKKNEERIKNLKNKQYYEIGIVVLLIVIIMVLLLNFNLDNSKKVNIKYLLCLSIILLIIVYNFDKNYIENFATKAEQFTFIEKYIKNINLTNVIGINEKVIKDDFDQVVKSDLIGINSDFLKIKGNEISINENYNKLNREKRVTKYSIYLVIYLLIVILLLNVLLVELNLDKKILYILGIILLIMGICLYIYMVTSIRERDSFKYYFPI